MSRRLHAHAHAPRADGAGTGFARWQSAPAARARVHTCRADVESSLPAGCRTRRPKIQVNLQGGPWTSLLWALGWRLQTPKLSEMASSGQRAEEAVPGESVLVRLLASAAPEARALMIDVLRNADRDKLDALAAKIEAAVSETEPEPEPQGTLSTAGGYSSGDLRLAASGGDASAIDRLLAAGVDPNAPEEQLAQWPPLFYAAMQGHLEIVRTLIAHGASVGMADRKSESAMSIAAYWGHMDIVEILQAEHRRLGVPMPTPLPDAVVITQRDAIAVPGEVRSYKEGMIGPGSTVLTNGREGRAQDAPDMFNNLLVSYEDTDGGSDTWWGEADQLQCVVQREKLWRDVRMGDDGHICILTSTPEWGVDGEPVMKELELLCKRFPWLSFGYDWGGSSTAEPADSDPDRLVPDCCLSLACSCTPRSVRMVKGPVDWSDAKSVNGSVWFPKYEMKVAGTLSSEAQREGVKFLQVLTVNGGFVSQHERRTMPSIITMAVSDLRTKGISISMVGSQEDTTIKVFLRALDISDLFAQIEEVLPTAPSPGGLGIRPQDVLATEHLIAAPAQRCRTLENRRYCVVFLRNGFEPTLACVVGADPSNVIELPLMGMRVTLRDTELTLVVSSLIFPRHALADVELKLHADLPTAEEASALLQGWSSTLKQHTGTKQLPRDGFQLGDVSSDLRAHKGVVSTSYSVHAAAASSAHNSLGLPVPV